MKPSKSKILESIDAMIMLLRIGGARPEGGEALRIAESLGIARDFLRDKYRDNDENLFRNRREEIKGRRK